MPHYFSIWGMSLIEDVVKDFYEKEATIYEETRFKTSHGIYVDCIQKSTVFKLIGNCKGKRILEIGSGTGRFTRELLKLGSEVVCIDLSRKMHEQSRAHTLLGSDDADYFLMDGSYLGFANNSFDVCVIINVMSHIHDNSQTLGEIRRILKNGGFVIANFPNMCGFYFPIGFLVNFFGRSLQMPVYSKWYSARSIFSLINYLGLNPVRLIGHMVFPKKNCPEGFFNLLKSLDNILKDSFLALMCGDLFLKAIKKNLDFDLQK